MKMNFIFDFDGTLVNSFYSVIEKFNLLADEFNFRKVNVNEIENLKNLSSKELIKYLKIPIYKIPRVILKARVLMHNEMKVLPGFENLRDTLQNIYDSNVNLGILTSNSEENVTQWLKHNKIYDFFNFIHIESSYFGKKRVLKKIIKSYKMDKEATFYIGDETRDVEAAKECGIYSVAVTWGFNSEKFLSQHQPHFIARKPEDILAVCKTQKVDS